MDIILNLLFTSVFLTFIWIIVSIVIDNMFPHEAEALEKSHPRIIKYVLGVPLLVLLASDIFLIIVFAISFIWLNAGCV